MSSRRARHRRPDQSSLAGERLLARLAPRPGAVAERAPTTVPPLPAVPEQPVGWVPTRPPDPATRQRTVPALVPSRRAVTGLVLVVVVAVLVALVVVWRAQPAAQAAPRVQREAPSSAGADAVASSPPNATVAAGDQPEVVVHVVGAVRHPGLVRLAAGSRVADAVRAAGGATDRARTASVNLARPLVDGEQVVVQRRGTGPAVIAAPVAGAAAAAPGPSAPVDLNGATLEALDGLPGIGPVLAQRVLDWRTAHGRFSAVDELGEVSGIGEATLSDLRPLVTL